MTTDRKIAIIGAPNVVTIGHIDHGRRTILAGSLGRMLLIGQPAPLEDRPLRFGPEREWWSEKPAIEAPKRRDTKSYVFSDKKTRKATKQARKQNKRNHRK